MRNFAKIYDAMNNKIIIILSVLTAFLVTGCKETHNRAIDLAYHLTATAPDSALSVLNGVDQAKLGKAEMARYALVYTIAQDKSGQDVDNDSLLRTAYTYYNNREQDSLYSKCEYYMGKYYMLNDSTEQANDCLQKAADVAEKQGDKYTQCLALEKLSKVLGNSNPRAAVLVARKADRIYSGLPNATNINKAYFRLQVTDALLLADSLDLTEEECVAAIKLTKLTGDSICISDAYQDMASILSQKKDYKGSLWCSRQSCELSNNNDVSKLLNLAWAYLDADSLERCKVFMNKIKVDKPNDLYIYYYIRHLAATKEHDYSNAVSFADSAYHYIEEMYGNELNDKEKYYTSLVTAQYEKGISEEKANLLIWVIGLIFLSAIVVVIFIVYAFRQYKLKAKRKIKYEKERHEMEEKTHEEELRHKEIQLSTMRSYLLKKINIAKRIEEIRGNKKDVVVLTEEDWEEIRMFVDNVEGNFISRLRERFPNLSDDDVKFMILLRLKMSSKAMGLIYNISEKSIRQKLFVYKSKVGLEGGNSPSLRSFIEAF
ncbi:hypothetical protein PRLR5107_17490 [Prevotella lacticifex]|uniref:Tetratricopeptide repeat protein n=3 Tax=Prevotella lacticifex TaxID=2854755 RepID=A0A9R1CAW3_9BACT|nr:hypothetical protein PRLR5019_08860 [Prevotella lacticifex]GJG42404.1 hypothetical protein PRLR5025_11900 [Prevotella lacticifex]GJG45270.1 hypothetical protein PRLR5027_08650 [Prevotella lacticifex]GJG48755.1 hypothetical protein PRLR5052_11680 [Prevotella lacticifex]GJG54831.1 hypothetical protein PRLR5067_08670 [Prevotella lacticifex]